MIAYDKSCTRFLLGKRGGRQLTEVVDNPDYLRITCRIICRYGKIFYNVIGKVANGSSATLRGKSGMVKIPGLWRRCRAEVFPQTRVLQYRGEGSLVTCHLSRLTKIEDHTV